MLMKKNSYDLKYQQMWRIVVNGKTKESVEKVVNKICKDSYDILEKVEKDFFVESFSTMAKNKDNEI